MHFKGHKHILSWLLCLLTLKWVHCERLYSFSAGRGCGIENEIRTTPKPNGSTGPVSCLVSSHFNYTIPRQMSTSQCEYGKTRSALVRACGLIQTRETILFILLRKKSSFAWYMWAIRCGWQHRLLKAPGPVLLKLDEVSENY